jgi:hypothetical protein
MEKRNIVLLVLLVLTLAVTGGHFAYKWVTDPASIRFPIQELRR